MELLHQIHILVCIPEKQQFNNKMSNNQAAYDIIKLFVVNYVESMHST